MDRVSAFARRRRIKNLEDWTLYAVLAEAFFLALSPTIAAAVVVFGTITWFLRSRIDTHYKMRSLPFDVPVAIFLLLGAVSVFLSSARSFELIYNYCSLVGIYALTYLIVGQTVQTPAQVKQVVQALGASAVLVVLWGFFQFAFGVDVADVKWTDPEAFPELRKRIFSTLENPNVLAGYLDVFICLALGLLAKAPKRSQKIILIGAIVLLAACLAMTYSRGAFLTIALVFVVYGVLKDWRVIILFVLVTGIIAYGDANFIDRIFSTFNGFDSSEGVRVGIWVSTIAMISDHPFAGIGWGAYKFVYPQYNYYVADPNITIYHAHNIYLNCAAEIGIVGALAFFWYFFGTMIMSFTKSGRNAEDWLVEQMDKIFYGNNFLGELRTLINDKLENFANSVINLFGRKKSPPKKIRRAKVEVLHHEDMIWSEHTREKFPEENITSVENISVAGEKISTKIIKLHGESESEDNKSGGDWDDVTNIDDKNFLGGLKLGIGLAFLSMALNGFTDDLLFNIPSAMLMWQLGALSATIERQLIPNPYLEV